MRGRIAGVGAIVLVSTGLGAAFLVSGWDRSPRPPNEPGVCWRADAGSSHKATFTVITADAPNIVSCAADLELAYLTEGRSITGAYQGYYIFVEPAAITSAQRLNLIHYPVFDRAERAMIDGRLHALVDSRASPRGAASASASAS